MANDAAASQAMDADLAAIDGDAKKADASGAAPPADPALAAAASR